MRYVWSNEHREFLPIERSHFSIAPYVQGDLEEFRTSSGVRVRGKAQYREHLKRTGTIEVGQKDLMQGQEKWQSRKSDFQQRLAKADKLGVRDISARMPEGEIRGYERSELNKRVANRLDGRGSPDRKTLIRITLEEARRR